MTTCIGPDCEREAWARDLCGAHYQQARTANWDLTVLRPITRTVGKLTPCRFEDCTNRANYKASGLCHSHQRQLHRRGELRPLGEGRPDYGTGQGRGTITPTGYRVLLRPNHPSAQPNGKIFEHRMVMSDHLGRPLQVTEVVHHKNGNRLDNRLENLELWNFSHPSGQRVEDKIAWAREFLALYGLAVVKGA